eukprot:10046998-Ditylum_brightwellii.AAC.1
MPLHLETATGSRSLEQPWAHLRHQHTPQPPLAPMRSSFSNGVWVPPDNLTDEETEWRAFRMLLNMWFGMEWTFELANTSANFMDLAITIKNGKITTKLYEKSLNLYLYIPPHSAHPPGVLNGIIFGQIHCIFTLCSERANISKSINQFYI